VELIKADHSDGDPRINTDLDRFKRAGLPQNIIVPADPTQPLIIMPEWIGPDKALQALEQALGK